VSHTGEKYDKIEGKHKKGFAKISEAGGERAYGFRNAPAVEKAKEVFRNIVEVDSAVRQNFNRMNQALNFLYKLCREEIRLGREVTDCANKDVYYNQNDDNCESRDDRYNNRSGKPILSQKEH